MEVILFITGLINKYFTSLKTQSYFGISYLSIFIGFVIIDIVIFTIIHMFSAGGIQKGDAIKKDLQKQGTYNEHWRIREWRK